MQNASWTWAVGLSMAFACFGMQSSRADEQTEVLLALEQRLQKSDGDMQKIVQIANESVERKVDVATLIVLYAGRNLTRVAIETKVPPVGTDFEGKKPLEFDETARNDGGASQIMVVLITAQAPRSAFRQEVARLIGQTEKQAHVATLLARTVSNYSVKALQERVKEKRSKWPFPLCLPYCDE